MNDLDHEELELHRVLSAARPASLPIGFRDAVMSRVRGDGTATRWEWIFAAILVAAQGLDQTSGADVVIDGLAVISLALVGIGSAVAAHAMLRSGDRQRMITR